MKGKPRVNRASGRSLVTRVATPRFASEQEEADWWDQHPEVIEDVIARTGASGAVAVESDVRRLTKPTNIRFYADDLAAARKLAHRKGLKLQTYIKMVLHEAIERESKAG